MSRAHSEKSRDLSNKARAVRENLPRGSLSSENLSRGNLSEGNLGGENLHNKSLPSEILGENMPNKSLSGENLARKKAGDKILACENLSSENLANENPAGDDNLSRQNPPNHASKTSQTNKASKTSQSTQISQTDKPSQTIQTMQTNKVGQTNQTNKPSQAIQTNKATQNMQSANIQTTPSQSPATQSAPRKVCLIPARGGSKRIPLKNIKPFCGEPIIAYSIRTALDSGLFDEVIVSTDSEQIAQVARDFGASVPFLRPAALSDDFTPTIAVAQHAIHALNALNTRADLALNQSLENLDSSAKSISKSTRESTTNQNATSHAPESQTTQNTQTARLLDSTSQAALDSATPATTPATRAHFLDSTIPAKHAPLLDSDLLCVIYPTAPLLCAASLSRALEALLTTPHKSFAFGAVAYDYNPYRSFHLKNSAPSMLFPSLYDARSQDLEAVFHDAGQFYWGFVRAWNAGLAIFAPHSCAIELSALEVQDIDTLDDWALAEMKYQLLQNKREAKS